MRLSSFFKRFAPKELGGVKLELESFPVVQKNYGDDKKVVNNVKDLIKKAGGDKAEDIDELCNTVLRLSMNGYVCDTAEAETTRQNAFKLQFHAAQTGREASLYGGSRHDDARHRNAAKYRYGHGVS
ncbi:MAG: hypothetical protein V1721_10410 [Pseudomonadota bacterium]